MKLQLIEEIMAGADLPPLSKEQLLALAKTSAGKIFETALLRCARGDSGGRTVLKLVSHSHSPATRSKLRALGFQCHQAQLTKMVLDEGQSFISMLEKAMQEPTERPFFVAYMVGLGHKPVAPDVELGAAPYYSFKVFAKSAALTISEARTRKGNAHTIQIDGARALNGGGASAYDWQNKIIVQLTTTEMYQVLALLENKIESVQLDGHGDAHDKFLHLRAQESRYFVRMGQRDRFAIAVPITPPDAVMIISLLYKQILANDKHLSANDLGQFIDRMATMMTAPAA
ncbi:hypothetical protein LPN04_29850 [Rugamonas sp. A1-17]|nr:hypothetical protein [Rugamonas sp. A1-17]